MATVSWKAQPDEHDYPAAVAYLSLLAPCSLAEEPVLLVRGELRTGLPLIVADGYHRLCASYHVDGATDIPCRVVDRPVGFR
jgi:hypothetical protein